MMKNELLNIDSISENELSDSEQKINTRLGYSVKVLDKDGRWLNTITLPDDNSHIIQLQMTYIECQNTELNVVIKSFYFYLFQRYIPSTLFRYHRAIGYFCQEINAGVKLEIALEQVILKNPSRNTSIIKLLIKFLILNEVEELSLDKAEGILRLKGYRANSSSYLKFFILDEELGPYTREELKVLNAAKSNTKIPIEERVILTLCLAFGLRAIQLSLLKESDFIEEPALGVSYLNIPRVKQKGDKRRESFSKRLVTDEDALLIKTLIQSNAKKIGYSKTRDCPLFCRKSGFDPNDRHIARNEKIYKNKRLDSAYHVQPELYNYRLRSIIKHLPKSPRTGRNFYFTVYRFRYTVGTNAVLNGMTEEEVADLLDHSNANSVKHYFRYTREMWELLEDATQKRTEQKHFTAAWCRDKDLKGNIYGKEVIEPHAFTAIGKCQKEKACHLEPALACYSCNLFCPNKDISAHQNALENLDNRKNWIANNATESISKQLDEAMSGCHAAIAFAEDKEIIFTSKENNIHKSIIH